MIVDGKAIASDILAETKKRMALLARDVVVRAVVVNPSPATESYLKVKTERASEAGMRMDVVHLADGVTEREIQESITAPGADAIIVQLPLPTSYNQQSVLDSIPVEADADVLSHEAVARFEQGGSALVPPVAAAVETVLERSGIEVRGKRTVVVGQGKLVGKPVATMLASLGADVVILTKESDDLSALKEADMVVLGAGVPRLVKPEHLKEGVILLDAGTSEEGGAIVGDADPACAHVASVFTPVPGGMGPIAVACLFKNVAELVCKHDSLQAS